MTPLGAVLLALAVAAPEPLDAPPVFASGRLAAARAALEHDPARTLRLLDGAGRTSHVRFLRALARLRVAPDEDAAAEMEEVAAVLPALADRCHAEAGLALEARGAWARAEAALRAVPEGSRLEPDARFALARILVRQGRTARADEALAPLERVNPARWPGRDVRAEALAARAALADVAGDAARATALRWELWAAHPGSPQADEARARLGTATPSADARLRRAEALLDAGRPDAASTEAGALVEAPDAVGCRARAVLGRVAALGGDAPRAESLLDDVARRCPAAPALEALARVLRGHAPGRAAEALESLGRLGEAPDAARALVEAATLRDATGRPEAAEADLRAVAAAPGPWRAEALFRLFWRADRAGRAAEAMHALDALAGETDGDESARVAYWRARVLARTGAREAARDAWARLAREHPAGYYGALARTRLEAEGTPLRVEEVRGVPARPVPSASGTSLLGTEPHAQAGLALLRMGFRSAAALELLDVPVARLPLPDVRRLVALLRRAGEARGARRLAQTYLRRDLESTPGPATLEAWRAAYPDTDAALLRRAAADARVDAALLSAVVAEESGFDPHAVSAAGARGLGQLTLATAADVARRIGVPRPSARELESPELNLRLAAHHLGWLLDRYDGAVPRAIAAYNAGPATVDRWPPPSTRAELDAWVEEIPFLETRLHVKRVLRSWLGYRALR